MTATVPTSLRVVHDGIRANAHVIHGGNVARLDDVLAAGLQADTEMAASYRMILAEIAPRLCLVIRKEIDGSHDNGCCWLAVELREGINGDTLTSHRHRLTSAEFRGWHLTDADMRREVTAILRRAAQIGLAQAEYWHGEDRTIAAVLARRGV